MSRGTLFIRDIVCQKGKGIPSFCSSNEYVLKAALEYARDNDEFVLIECTANQVNQYGGYTGMSPTDFRDYVYSLAKKTGTNQEKIILGGDHLGPTVFKHMNEADAMREAEVLISEFVKAGFEKIHIDTSMRLASDAKDCALTDDIIAKRGARLCLAAERAFEATYKRASDLIYVVGSEVPVPGGTAADEKGIKVTSPEDFEKTFHAFENAFKEVNLGKAFERVVAVVVQPGVEFGDESIHEYAQEAAIDLVEKLEAYPHIAFEGHSTDYQTPGLLRAMVHDGIAILKVGPELTFALREGLFALQFIIDEITSDSDFTKVLDLTMQSKPEHWLKYYTGTNQEIFIKRKYSYSDRWRYYANEPEIISAVHQLFSLFNHLNVPLPLVSQFLPEQYKRIRNGVLELDAEEIVKDKVREIIDKYYLSSK